MYGCNLLHLLHRALRPGRERSRKPEIILDEIRGLVAGGKGHHPSGPERQLLRQGSGRAHGLRRPAQGRLEIPGDFLLRFATQPPKGRLQGSSTPWRPPPRSPPCFPCPSRRGTTSSQKAMNRVVRPGRLPGQVRRLRQAIPRRGDHLRRDHGLPRRETAEGFEFSTRPSRHGALRRAVHLHLLPPGNTPAAKMDDPIPKAEKAAHFQRLVEQQDQISEEKHAAYIGKTVPLPGGRAGRQGLTARTPRQPAGAPDRGRGSDRPVCGRRRSPGPTSGPLSGEPA